MSDDPRDDPTTTPEAMLDQLRAHPEWDEAAREDFLGRLVGRFPPGRVREAIRPRLADLDGPDAEPILRLIEADPEPTLLDALAAALEAQPGLTPERAWAALAVLEGAGALDRHPALVERWNDLVELLDEDDPIAQLVEQIEGDPEGVSLALQGLGAVEADVRPEIVAGLAGLPLGPGLLEFLRLLAYTPDEPTRAAAVAVLLDAGPDEDGLAAVWRDLAANHPDPDLRFAAAARLSASPPAPVAARPGPSAPSAAGPRLLRSLVTAVDGRGRASIALASEAGGRAVLSAFACDVTRGVVDVLGEFREDRDAALAGFEALADGIARDLVRDRHDLALGLLAGCLWLGGPGSPPAARYWVEAAVGGGLRPRPLVADRPSPGPFGETPARALEVLDACPDWVDESPLTREIAEEILLREGNRAPDPARDAGAYRFLFEHRLRAEVERYRRMLFWNAEVWAASGRDALAASARAISDQLSDPQHVVPGHPFTVALTTRSLSRALRSIGPR